MNLANWKLVLDKIKADPSCWKQSEWHCGTKHCFGGWAQILGGNKPEGSFVRQQARVFLEISRTDADYWFAPERTLEDFEWALSDEARDNAGYDRAGYDRAGYNRDGYNRDGYNRDGYNRDGYDRDGYNRAGYDRDGYNRDGYDSDGLDRDNKPKAA